MPAEEKMTHGSFIVNIKRSKQEKASEMRTTNSTTNIHLQAADLVLRNRMFCFFSLFSRKTTQVRSAIESIYLDLFQCSSIFHV